MKFGVHLLTGYPNGTDCDIQTGINETAKAAEALGYDSVWTNDVVVLPSVYAENPAIPNYAIPIEPLNYAIPIEPLITLASLIHLTPHINLGLSVLVLPQRNAFVVAKQTLALDILSNGRLLLGVGTGWRDFEFNILGADFANRGLVTDEAIQVLRTLWRETDASFDGSFYQFADVCLNSKPAESGPPIWIGGNSNSAARRAAKFGDVWIPIGLDVDELRQKAALMRSLVHDRPVPSLSLEAGVLVYPDGQDPPDSLPAYHFEASIAGYSDQIIETLTAYQEVGVENLVCVFYVDQLAKQLEQMQLFAEKVMPTFAM